MFRVVVGSGVAAAVGLLAVAVGASAQSAERPVVTAAGQVTTDPLPTRAHSSPTMARNPKTGELVIAEGEVRTDGRCFAYISADDGRSWFRGGNMMRKPFTDCALSAEYGPYASAAFAKDGTLYVAFVASERREPQSGEAEGPGEALPRNVYLARSSDSGRSFTTATVFRPPPGNADLAENKGPTVAVDPSDASRVYVGWRQGEFMGDKKLRSSIAASSDGGRTFSAPVDISGKNGGDYPNMTVDSEGTLHAIYWVRDFGADENFVRPIIYRQSTDFGKTFAPPVQVDTGNQDSERVPMIATAPQPGTLYTVWSTTPERKNGAEDFEGNQEIFFSRSGDGGRTWSPRRVLNDDRNPDVAQSLPGIAVAPNGRVDVAWYDDRFEVGTFPAEDGDEVTEDEPTAQNVFYTSSEDQGRSFGPNVRISDRHIDRSVGVWENNIFSAHNVAMDSSDDGAYFAWQDTRNADPVNQAEDIYTAKLARSASSVESGGGGGSNVIWALLGGGGALALGGLLLVGGAGWARRSR